MGPNDERTREKCLICRLGHPLHNLQLYIRIKNCKIALNFEINHIIILYFMLLKEQRILADFSQILCKIKLDTIILLFHEI